MPRIVCGGEYVPGVPGRHPSSPTSPQPTRIAVIGNYRHASVASPHSPLICVRRWLQNTERSVYLPFPSMILIRAMDIPTECVLN